MPNNIDDPVTAPPAETLNAEEEIKDIANKYAYPLDYVTNRDKNKVQVLYFNYKTHMNNVYKLKNTATGAEKVIEKDDTFNPPDDKQGDFSKL